MWLIVTTANPLFSAMGSTEVFRFGLFAIYAESLLYGACSGGMLASVFLWFSSYSACMNSDNSLGLVRKHGACGYADDYAGDASCPAVSFARTLRSPWYKTP